MQEIKIIKEVKPVIEMNFQDVKTALEDTLQKYKGLIVTEETLSGCKATQKELAGVRTKLDTWRKEKKKELSKPISEFEDKCKELISLVEKAEQPIKEGIKVFDDAKRDEKRKVAEKLIQEVAEEQGLEPKYSARLEVLDKYCNLTAKESDVKNDLTQKAIALLVEQDREKELLEIIKDCINTENQRINTKMELKDFQRLIDRGMQTKDILAEIKAKAETIYQAENPPVRELMVEPITETYLWKAEKEPENKPIQEPVPFEPESTYFAVYRITGTENQLKSVSSFLKANGIQYGVAEQGEL